MRIHIVCFALLIAATARASDTVAQSDLRSSIEKSLPFIEKEGQWWKGEKNCMSCHFITFVTWSHTGAQARGIAVDKANLKEWTDWCEKKSLEQRAWFKLTDQTLAALKAESIAEPILAKFKTLKDKSYDTEKELLESLEQAFGKEELEGVKVTVRKVALATKDSGFNDGGGKETLGQMLLGHAHDSNSEFVQGSAALLIRWQQADGAWSAGGQLGRRTWPANVANETSTMWNTIALAALPRDEKIGKSIDKAYAFIKTAKPAKNTEWLLTRTLVEHKLGEKSAAENFLKELISSQNSDGGWNWRPETPSDAFATGQVLFALHECGVNESAPAVQKALNFLLSSQNADGSWKVARSSYDDRTNKEAILTRIYSFWGTSWSAIAMEQFLPKQ